MAIGTDDFVEKFGTQVAADDGSTSSVANDAFSVAADITTFTNALDAPFAAAVLESTFSVAPAAGTVVELFARLLNIIGTSDATVPDADFPHKLIGSFPIDTVTTSQAFQIEFKLPNGKSGQEYEFSIRNHAGQTMSAGWGLDVTPIAIGPKAA